MREFAKISSEFWTSPMGKKIRSCELETKVVAFYLMTCRHTNMLGIYYLPLILASHEIGIALEGVKRGIQALIKLSFCSYDEENEYVWIHETAVSQLGVLKKNDNRVKHANRVFKNLPQLPFLSKFYEKYCNFLHLEKPSFFEPIRSPFEALEIRDGRLDIGDERLEINKTPNIFLDELHETTVDNNQTNDDEEECGDNTGYSRLNQETNLPVFSIPLRQGKRRVITQSELENWQHTYSTVDVKQEIRQLVAWNQANPDRQKTERGINRHIQGWLAHTQQQQTQAARSSPHSLSTWEHNMAVMKAVLEEDCGN